MASFPSLTWLPVVSQPFAGDGTAAAKGADAAEAGGGGAAGATEALHRHCLQVPSSRSYILPSPCGSEAAAAAAA